MKKQYIKPELMVEKFDSEVLMFSGSIVDQEVGTETDQLSNGRGNRRGTWGNLWYTEQE